MKTKSEHGCTCLWPVGCRPEMRSSEACWPAAHTLLKWFFSKRCFAKNQGDAFWRRIMAEVELCPPYTCAEALACTMYMCTCIRIHAHTHTFFGVCLLTQLLSASVPHPYHHKFLHEISWSPLSPNTPLIKCGTDGMKLTLHGTPKKFHTDTSPPVTVEPHSQKCLPVDGMAPPGGIAFMVMFLVPRELRQELNKLKYRCLPFLTTCQPSSLPWACVPSRPLIHGEGCVFSWIHFPFTSLAFHTICWSGHFSYCQSA